MSLFWHKLGWATFWATFSQTHPVTLVLAVRTCFCSRRTFWDFWREQKWPAAFLLSPLKKHAISETGTLKSHIWSAGGRIWMEEGSVRAPDRNWTDYESSRTYLWKWAPRRVTRLGEFSPFGWLFTLDCFLENCRNSSHFWAKCFHG
jgi:hypothetical protein